MNYNDFPILDDSTYNLMMNEYNNSLPFDRNTAINKLYLELDECKNFCFGLTNRVNKKIQLAVESAKTEIEKILENFHATFSIHVNSQKEIKEFNLFTFIKKLISSISNMHHWANNEQKTYFKTLAGNNIITLINILMQIIEALENSNLHLFKFM